MHALRRDVFFAHEGHVRHRHLEQQTEQALCLTLVINAIITWTTEYLGLAVDRLRAEGREVSDELVAHISRARNENIGFYGTFRFDVERELSELDPAGYRPLRDPRRDREAEVAAVNGVFTALG